MRTLQVDRDFYASSIGVLKNNLKQKRELEQKIGVLTKSLYESQSLYVRMLNAQKVLSMVSDENTNITLEFITGMVNKVLSEMFPNDHYYIKLTSKLYAGCKPHIILELYDAENNVLDISTQVGDGMKQVICFMYVLCLIEIRKGRRLLILDERLNGLHKNAKKCISKIIEIFVKGGFQFIFVEYSLNDIGKIYNVERHGNESRLEVIEGEYSDDLVYINEVDLSVLDEEVEEE